MRPDLPLLLLANRDEYFARPTAELGFWQDHPAILGGRDLQAGGTWLAFSRDGRWAAVTNVRNGEDNPDESRSRGELVANYLRGTSRASEYADRLEPDLALYRGFNLLLGEPSAVLYVSNRAPRAWLEPGVHGVSNATLNTEWPKLIEAREAVERQVNLPVSTGQLMEIFMRRGPEGGLGSIFVDLPVYGTRSTTLAVRQAGQLHVWEMTHPQRSVRFEKL